MKILIVDDEKDILEFLSYNLQKEGYEIFRANNGNSALKVAKKEIPDLIILDVMMPEMDGIETCEKIREIESLDSTLILFLTPMVRCFGSNRHKISRRVIQAQRSLTSKETVLLKQSIQMRQLFGALMVLMVQ